MYVFVVLQDEFFRRWYRGGGTDLNSGSEQVGCGGRECCRYC